VTILNADSAGTEALECTGSNPAQDHITMQKSQSWMNVSGNDSTTGTVSRERIRDKHLLMSKVEQHVQLQVFMHGACMTPNLVEKKKT
jgi:outer membrane receptor for ferrienterochelin and colicin